MQNTNFINRLKEIARPLARSLALPETEDPRVLQAASMLLESQAIDFIHLFGNPLEIFDLSDKHHISLRQFQSKIRWARADDQTLSQGTLQHCRKQAALRGKNIRPEDEVSILNSPLDKAAFLLADGQVDAVVAGCVASTAEVIRAALRGVGLAPGCSTMSGSFAMIREIAGTDPLHYLFADSAVVVDPSVEQIVDIAGATLTSFQALFPDEEPKLAFLSFSSHGSALHPRQKKMADATKIFQQRFPHIKSDGELQFDAAIDLAISQRKAPASQVAGKANCFIFPDLDSGNIAYKIAQRLGNFAAYGPILQGAAKPFSDLSRGASADDIAAAGLMAVLRANR